MLVGLGLNPSSINDQGISCLHLAAQNNHILVINYLLKLGVDINIQDYDRKTALHWAVYYNHYDTVEYLLLENASVDIVDKDKNYPLHYGALKGLYGVVRVLLEFGSKDQIHAKNNKNETPYSYVLPNSDVNNNSQCDIIILEAAKSNIYILFKKYFKMSDLERSNYIIAFLLIISVLFCYSMYAIYIYRQLYSYWYLHLHFHIFLCLSV